METILNMYHRNIKEDSIEEEIIKARNKLGYLYIGKNNGNPPGQDGHIL